MLFNFFKKKIKDSKVNFTIKRLLCPISGQYTNQIIKDKIVILGTGNNTLKFWQISTGCNCEKCCSYYKLPKKDNFEIILSRVLSINLS